jgi:predicted DCC family thiol-disulfide oxidoreductase YuxK
VIWIRRRLRTAAQFLAYQDLDEPALHALGVSREQCVRRVQLVINGTTALSGGDACVELLRRCRWPWPGIAAVGGLKLIRPLVRLSYDAFARLRH